MSNFNRVVPNGDSIMFKNLIALAIAGLLLSGCYMVPLAFIGPASSGFTTASIIQSTISTAANHAVKKKTGKTVFFSFFSILKSIFEKWTFLLCPFLKNRSKNEKKFVTENLNYFKGLLNML